MGATVLTDRSGVVVLSGPPDRRSPPRLAPGASAMASRLAGPTYIVASCVSLQTAAALATTVFTVFGPVGTGALRFQAAAVVLLVCVRPRIAGRPARLWLAVTALGVATAATNVLLYTAIARIPLGLAGTLAFIGPLSLALLRARRRVDLVWAVGAGAGVVLLTRGLVAGSVIGVVCALGAAASVAASIVIAGHVGARTRGLDGLTLSITVAAVLTLPMGLPAALGSPAALDFAIVAVVGVLGVAVPYALELSALRRVGTRTYSILLSLDPAIAGLAGLVLLGQHLQPTEIVGVALVMAASAGAVTTQPAPGS
jgi:inner membrane transporter RhtA